MINAEKSQTHYLVIVPDFSVVFASEKLAREAPVFYRSDSSILATAFNSHVQYQQFTTGLTIAPYTMSANKFDA